MIRNFSLPGLFFLTLSCPFRTKGHQEMNQELQELAEVHERLWAMSSVLPAALC